MEETANPTSVSVLQITMIVWYPTTFPATGTKMVTVMHTLTSHSVALMEETVELQTAIQNFVMPLSMKIIVSSHLKNA